MKRSSGLSMAVHREIKDPQNEEYQRRSGIVNRDAGAGRNTQAPLKPAAWDAYNAAPSGCLERDSGRQRRFGGGERPPCATTSRSACCSLAILSSGSILLRRGLPKRLIRPAAAEEGPPATAGFRPALAETGRVQRSQVRDRDRKHTVHRRRATRPRGGRRGNRRAAVDAPRRTAAGLSSDRTGEGPLPR